MSESDSASSDIREILEHLQEEIHRHRLALGELGAIEKPDPLAQVRQHQWVNSHLPIGWPVMPKGIIPKLVAYAKKIARRLLRWYINPLIDQQNAYNAAVSELLSRFETLAGERTQCLRDLEAQVQRLEPLRALPQRLQTLETSVVELRQALEAQVDQLSHLTEGEVGEPRGSLAERVSRLQEVLEDDRGQLAHEREVTRLRLQRLENWRKKRAREERRPAVTTPPPLESRFDSFLLGLEQRGEGVVHGRLSDYDDVFADLQQAQQQGTRPRKPVLDIGCGRGEFVAHLSSLGLGAYGIEIDEDAIEVARDKGLDVRHDEALAHLQSLPDGSLAAIVLIQVIEHFGVGDLLSLFRLAAEKLGPGGLVVAETINPQCLLASSSFYLLDPEHRTLLHPLMTKSLMEQAGLWKVETRYLHPVSESARLERVPEGAPGHAGSLNRNTDKLNRFLYGPQDYAAIAYKPEA